MVSFSSPSRHKAAVPVTPEATSVAVIEEDAVVLAQLVDALQAQAGVRAFLCLDEVLEQGPLDPEGSVLVLGPSQMDEVVLDRTAALLQTRPSVGALMVVEEADAAVLRIALRAGLDDAVAMARVGEDLPQAVKDLSFRLRSARPAFAGPAQVTTTRRRGRVTTVFSPKGGVGKSVVAVNLATALARRDGQTVALVDLDVDFGDVGVMLRLKPSHHIGEAAAAGARLDGVLMRSLLTRDERSGLEVLAAPPGGAQGDRITAEAVRNILEVMRSLADHVVVDTAPSLDEPILEALLESDDIVYIVGMDVPAVKNARLGLQALELMQVPLGRVIVVLNRADSRVHLAPRDVERTLQMKVDASLPSDALVPQSVNTGSPAVVEFERSRFAGRIREMAALIAQRAAQEDPS